MWGLNSGRTQVSGKKTGYKQMHLQGTDVAQSLLEDVLVTALSGIYQAP